MNKFYVALLFVLVADVLQAQNPGGVGTNLSLWLKADNTSTLSPSTGSLTSWTYSNNPGNSFTASVGQQPTVAPNTFNFLPSIAFDGTQPQLMSGPAGVNAPIPAGQLNYTVFSVWSSSRAAGTGLGQRIWSERPASSLPDGNSDGVSLWVYTSGFAYGDQGEIPNDYTSGTNKISSGSGTIIDPWRYQGAPILPYGADIPYVSMMQLYNQNTNDLLLMDQSNFATGGFVTSTDPTANATADRILSNQANILGVRSVSGLDEPFTGNVAELIVYAGNLTAAQQNAVFSYLSIKYGIPLGGDLTSSAGTVIWASGPNGNWGTGATNFNYNHFVFGLGMDNGSGLTTTQSNSLSTGSGNGSGQSGSGNIILANPSTPTDQNFMLIGSNNAGFAEITTNLPTTSPVGAKRLATQWLIHNNGSVGKVDFSFDFTGITTTGSIGTSADFALVVDNDGDGDFTTGTQSVYAPSSWNGNVATWTQVNLATSLNVVVSILSNSNATPLPVNWLSFTAKANGADVDLNWTVSANENAKVYQVQHSTDGASFSTIGEVSNLANVQSYGFVHANAGPGTHYYRVLETDQDGKSIYSKIVSVVMSGSDFAIRLLNNPVVGNSMDAEVEITASDAGNASFEIWNLTGRRVATLMQNITDGTSRIRLPMSTLPAGTYAVKIRVNDVTHVVQVVKL